MVMEQSVEDQIQQFVYQPSYLRCRHEIQTFWWNEGGWLHWSTAEFPRGSRDL